MTTIPIPDDVRDNSETVTDYAFSRHLSTHLKPPTPAERDRDLELARGLFSDSLGYRVKTWYEVTSDGQRCRRDQITNVGGVIHDFHTLYWTRVPCATHDAHYAAYYASITDPESGITTVPAAYCDECVANLSRSAGAADMTLNLSEPLLIGQHD